MQCVIETLTAQVPVGEYIRTCVDVEKFLGYCRQCPNFQKNWACPPHSFHPMVVWEAYGTLRLYARVLTPGEGMDRETFLRHFRREKERLSCEVLAMEQEIPGSRSMAAGTCTCCSPCARAAGRPCLHPEQVRQSIEALGGDVGKTMERYLHKPLQWMEKDGLPAYLTLVAGLLLP